MLVRISENPGAWLDGAPAVSTTPEAVLRDPPPNGRRRVALAFVGQQSGPPTQAQVQALNEGLAAAVRQIRPAGPFRPAT